MPLSKPLFPEATNTDTPRFLSCAMPSAVLLPVHGDADASSYAPRSPRLRLTTLMPRAKRLSITQSSPSATSEKLPVPVALRTLIATIDASGAMP